MAKRKKAKRRISKAEQEYKRTRNRLLKARRRAEQAGSRYYFDLPPTPAQMAKGTGKKATAKEYREALKGLKGLESVFKKVRRRERQAPEIDMSMDTINSFLQGLDWPTAHGGHVIIQKTMSYVQKYGPEVVARAIADMQDAGDLVESAEFYNADEGTAYMARMGTRIRQLDKMDPAEWADLEDRIFGNQESVPEDLQRDRFGRTVEDLLTEYGLNE